MTAGRIILLAAVMLAAGCAGPEAVVRHPVRSMGFIADSMPTPQCHASTLAESGGRLVAAWFGGTHEGSPDTRIWFTHREAAGWAPPRAVADGLMPGGERYPCWNPVLHPAKDGTLMLFYKVGPNPREWWGMLKTSQDDGRTWGPPVRLPNGIAGPVRTRPIEPARGVLLCPSSTEDRGWQVWMERTADQGWTWSRSGPLNDTASIEAIQPSLLWEPDGTVLALGRTRQGRMFSMTSADTGRTWTPMRLLEFLCSNAGVDGTVLADGRRVVAYNHARNHPDDWWVGRDTVALAVSDDGRRWAAGALLEVEPGAEFSYPSILQTRDGALHVTYTWKRKLIRHVILDPGVIAGRPYRGLEWP